MWTCLAAPPFSDAKPLLAHSGSPYIDYTGWFQRSVNWPVGRSLHIGMPRTAPLSSANLPLDRSVVLVGMMGAGKTAVGRRLAAVLDWPFTDADSAIEEAAGTTIANIFAEIGEAAFREQERRVIARLLRGGRQVLALGGGAFMDPETRALIRERAISIWLRADPDTLLKRTSRRNDRPLLATPDRRATLTALLAERTPVYAEADLVVDSSQGPLKVVVGRVLEALASHLDEASP